MKLNIPALNNPTIIYFTIKPNYQPTFYVNWLIIPAESIWAVMSQFNTKMGDRFETAGIVFV